MSVIELIGVLVPIASAVASGVNESVRNSGGQPSKGMATFQVIINALALNIDKVKQAVGIIKK